MANGALAWIVFHRDSALFSELFPEFMILSYQPHTPFRYWLAGGLKRWSILPAICFPLATWLDNKIAKAFPNLSSFVAIEVERMPSPYYRDIA